MNKTPFERWLDRELSVFLSRAGHMHYQDAVGEFADHLANSLQTLDVEINEYKDMVERIPGITPFYGEVAAAIINDFHEWLMKGDKGGN